MDRPDNGSYEGRLTFAVGGASRPVRFCSMSDPPRLRHSVRILLLDEEDRLLLFRAEDHERGRAFWFPAGGGLEEGEDVRAAGAREVAEETGLLSFELDPRCGDAVTSSSGAERYLTSESGGSRPGSSTSFPTARR